MAFIMELLTGTLGPFGPIIVVGMLGVFLILITIGIFLNQREDPLQKLKKSQKAPPKTEKRHQKLRSGNRNDKLDKYANFLEPQDEKSYSEMRTKLLQAGYRNRDAVRYFHFAQFSLGICFLVLGVLYYLIFKAGGESDTKEMLLYILGPGGAG